MKKIIALVGVTIVMAIGAYNFGYNVGYVNSFEEGVKEGRLEQLVEDINEIEEEVRDSVGTRGEYYGVDGFTVKYEIVEGNINDELRD